MAPIYPVIAAENDAALYARGQTVPSESTQDKHQRDGADLIAHAAEAGHAPAQFHLVFFLRAKAEAYCEIRSEPCIGFAKQPSKVMQKHNMLSASRSANKLTNAKRLSSYGEL
tara:strand:+ start:421 stop:759 length:339 start_codon:yes stop_codon:yes gene_type:complete